MLLSTRLTRLSELKFRTRRSVVEEKTIENGWIVVEKKTVQNPLHQMVQDYMLHGPCGSENPTLSCMRDGYCKYGYKKDYISATELSEDGFPLYRRRSPEEGGNSCLKWRGGKRVQYTNADVVPYQSGRPNNRKDEGNGFGRGPEGRNAGREKSAEKRRSGS